MRKGKGLLIAVLVVAGLGAGGFFGWKLLAQNRADPVKVYNFDLVGMTEYWGDSKESYGPVSSDKIQTIFLSDTQTVSEIAVEEGQQVKKGDLLMRFDTTLSQLELERKDLEIQKIQMELEEAREELQRINWMVPMGSPPTEPETEPTQPDLGWFLGDLYYPYLGWGRNGSSPESAFVCWIRNNTVINKELLQDKIGKDLKKYLGMYEKDPVEDPTEEPTEENPGDEPTQEPPTDGPEVPTEPETPGEIPTEAPAETPPTEAIADVSEEQPAVEITGEEAVVMYTDELMGSEEPGDTSGQPEQTQPMDNTEPAVDSTEHVAGDETQPMEGTGDAQTGDAETQPVQGEGETQPAEGETAPTEGEETQPTEEEETEPTGGEETQPTEEEETEPTGGEETQPTEGEETEPTEGEGETDPTEGEETEPTEGEEETEPDEGEETKPEKPKPVKKEPICYYMVLKMTKDNMSKGETTLWQGVYVMKDSSIVFFDASGIPDYTLPQEEPEEETMPSMDWIGSGYTYSQIAKMRQEQEKKIQDLELSLKLTEADYKIMERELSDGNIYAEIDGKVLSVLGEEEAKLNQQPVVKLSGGGGFYVEGSISELERSSMEIGQEVTVNDWESGMTYTGVVKSIGDIPSNSSNRYGADNPNASSYPFIVFVDETADLRAGSFASIQYSSSSAQNGVYLQNPFLRKIGERAVVYVRGEDGLLEEREVTTGKSLWGSYIEIVDGLTADDLVAFPYGKNVRPGVPAEEGDMNDLYGY